MKTTNDQIFNLLTTLVDRVDKIEKTIVTKDDLKTMATKDDLKSLATKVELKNMEKSLKKDIKNLDKKVEYYFKTLNRDLSSDRRRIIRIEKHIHLPFNPLES